MNDRSGRSRMTFAVMISILIILIISSFASAEILLSEDFESNSFSTNQWDKSQNYWGHWNVLHAVDIVKRAPQNNEEAHSGKYFVRFLQDNIHLTTRPIDVRQVENLNLEYYFKIYDIGAQDNFYVDVYDGRWNYGVKEYGLSDVHSTWLRDSLDLSSFNKVSNFKVRFRSDMKYQFSEDYFLLDDVKITSIDSATNTKYSTAYLDCTENLQSGDTLLCTSNQNKKDQLTLVVYDVEDEIAGSYPMTETSGSSGSGTIFKASVEIDDSFEEGSYYAMIFFDNESYAAPFQIDNTQQEIKVLQDFIVQALSSLSEKLELISKKLDSIDDTVQKINETTLENKEALDVIKNDTKNIQEVQRDTGYALNNLTGINKELSSNISNISEKIDVNKDIMFSLQDWLLIFNQTNSEKMEAMMQEMGFFFNRLNESQQKQFEEIRKQSSNVSDKLDENINSIEEMQTTMNYSKDAIDTLIENNEMIINTTKHLNDNLDSLEMDVLGGGEYKSMENGYVGVQLISSFGNDPINDAVCTVQIYGPNQNIFMENTTLDLLGEGIYYKKFTTPQEEGVYTSSFICRSGLREARKAHSFHIAPWANSISDIETTIEAMNRSLEDLSSDISDVYDNTEEILERFNSIDIGNITINLDEIRDSFQALNRSIQQGNEDLEEELKDEIESSTTALISKNQELKGMISQTLQKVESVEDEIRETNTNIESINSTVYSSFVELSSMIYEVNSSLSIRQEYFHNKTVEELEQKISESTDSLSDRIGQSASEMTDLMMVTSEQTRQIITRNVEDISEQSTRNLMDNISDKLDASTGEIMQELMNNRNQILDLKNWMAILNDTEHMHYENLSSQYEGIFNLFKDINESDEQRHNKIVALISNLEDNLTVQNKEMNDLLTELGYDISRKINDTEISIKEYIQQSSQENLENITSSLNNISYNNLRIMDMINDLNVSSSSGDDLKELTQYLDDRFDELEAIHTDIMVMFNFDQVVNEGAGDMESKLYIGDEEHQQGEWIPLFSDAKYIEDDTITKNVTGFALQRQKNMLRVVMHGMHPEYSDKEIVKGSLNFNNAVINNILQDPDGALEPSEVERLSWEEGSSYMEYDFLVNVHDDGFYVEYVPGSFSGNMQKLYEEVRNISLKLNQSEEKPSLQVVGGTEYMSGEEGKVSIQFLKYNLIPIMNADCEIDVYYPNNTLFVDDESMDYLADGIYEYNFTTPPTEGVYTASVYCHKGAWRVRTGHTFHVAPWANDISLIKETTLQINQSVLDLHTGISDIQSSLLGISNQINYVKNFLSYVVVPKIDNIQTDIDGIQLDINMIKEGIQTLENISQQNQQIINGSIGQCGSYNCTIIIDMMENLSYQLEDHYNNITSQINSINTSDNVTLNVTVNNSVNVTVDVQQMMPILSQLLNNTQLLVNNSLNINNSIGDILSRINFINQTNSYILGVLNTTLNSVGGTEYASGEEVSLNIQFMEGEQDIENAQCLINVYYPNKTLMKVNESMDYLDDGIYYYNFTAPLQEGVYAATYACEKDDKVRASAHSFHIAPWANEIGNISEGVDDINDTVSHINSTVDQINETVDQINDTVDQINDTVDDINDTVNDINETVENVNDTVGQINESVEDMGESIDDMNDSLYDINDSIHQKIEEEANSTRELIIQQMQQQTTTLIDQIQENHEKIDVLLGLCESETYCSTDQIESSIEQNRQFLINISQTLDEYEEFHNSTYENQTGILDSIWSFLSGNPSNQELMDMINQNVSSLRQDIDYSIQLSDNISEYLQNNISANQQNITQDIREVIDQNNDIIELAQEINLTTHEINITTNLFYSYLRDEVFPKINESDNKLDQLLQGQQNIWDETVEIKQDVEETKSMVNSSAEQIENLEQSMLDNFNQQNTILSQIEGNTNQILYEIQYSVMPKLNLMDTRTQSMQQDIGIIKDDTNDLKSGQSQIMTRLNELEQLINMTPDMIEDIREDILDGQSGIEEKLELFNDSLNSIKNNTEFIMQRQDEISSVTYQQLSQISNSTQDLIEQNQETRDYLEGTITDYLSSINSTLSSNILKVSGSHEYQSGETVRISAHLLRSNKTPINDASCELAVYYPNQTELISEKVMAHVGSGIYIANYTAPDVEGVFINLVDCDGMKESVTIHVAGWANEIKDIKELSEMIIDELDLLRQDTLQLLQRWGAYDVESIMQRLDELNDSIEDMDSTENYYYNQLFVNSQVNISQECDAQGNTSTCSSGLQEEIQELKDMMNQTRYELGAEGKEKTVYDKLVELDGKIQQVNSSLSSRIAYENGQVMQEVQSSSQQLVQMQDDINEILSEWDTFNSNDIFNEIIQNRDLMIELRSFVEEMNQNLSQNYDQQSQQNVSESVWDSLRSFFDKNNKELEDTIFQELLEKMNNSEEISDRIISDLGFTGKNATVYGMLANLSMSETQILQILGQMNISISGLNDKMDSLELALNESMEQALDNLSNLGQMLTSHASFMNPQELFSRLEVMDDKMDLLNQNLQMLNNSQDNHSMKKIEAIQDTLDSLREELGFEGKCAPASCMDGKQNQNEEGIDCGGACPSECIVPTNLDFELGSYQGWNGQGHDTPWGTLPSDDTRNKIEDQQGSYWVDGYYAGGDEPQGELVSDVFTINSDAIRLLIGGGNSNSTYVCLDVAVDGDCEFKQSGQNDEAFEEYEWDVSNFTGDQAVIRLVDQESGAWGHINTDNIRFIETSHCNNGKLDGDEEDIDCGGSCKECSDCASTTKLSVYEEMFHLRTQITEFNRTINEKMDLLNVSLDEAKSMIVQKSSEAIDSINSNNDDLIQIILNESQFSTQQIIQEIEENQQEMMELKLLIDDINQTVLREIKNDSNKLYQSLDSINKTIIQQHNNTLIMLSNLSEEIEITEDISNQILAKLNYNNNDSVSEDIEELREKINQLISICSQLNGYGSNTLSLSTGQNIRMMPTEPSNPDVSTVFSVVIEKLDSVHHHNGMSWLFYSPDAPSQINTLQEMHAGKEYWIYMNSPAEVVIS